MAYIRTDLRPCTANLANEVQLTPRVTDKRQRSGFAIWPGVRKFLKQLTAKSEPKPKIQEGFLAETWKRGGDYSSSGALRALMGMKDNIVCDGLSESQRSRLRHNLTEHGEVLAAINAVLRDVEHSDMPGGEYRNFLVYLQTSLNQVYDAVGCKQGTELRGNERKFEQLKNVLMDAWMLGDQSASPAERIEEQLKQLEGDPSQFMVSEKPGRLA